MPSVKSNLGAGKGSVPPPPPTYLLPALTKEEWRGMSPKAQWDSIVCLRGPDCPEKEGGQLVKYYSSSIIRARMMGIFPHIGGLVNRELHLALTSRGGKYVGWNASHFFEHIEEGCALLAIPFIRLPWELYVRVIQQGGKGGLKLVWDHAAHCIPSTSSALPSLEGFLRDSGIIPKEGGKGEDELMIPPPTLQPPPLPKVKLSDLVAGWGQAVPTPPSSLSFEEETLT